MEAQLPNLPLIWSWRYRQTLRQYLKDFAVDVPYRELTACSLLRNAFAFV